METHFAPPERASQAALSAEIKTISNNPVMSGLLHSISGLLAILDEHRQIIALNDSLMQVLGIDNPGEALGLRPGEALKCIHAGDHPAGCGTTQFCSSCGAAIAIVSSLQQGLPVERKCAVTATRGGKTVDIFLLVKSHPIEIETKKFILLFLQDITVQQHRAALERTFFHDVNNLLSMLVQASELLIEDAPGEFAETIHQAAMLLHREVQIQRYLAESETGNYQPMWHDYNTTQILSQLRPIFNNHPAARKKGVHFSTDDPFGVIKTDISALLRVLSNMIINALEGSDDDRVVKVWTQCADGDLIFCVWNHQAIPPTTSVRIFQRNFSTKKQAGRGIGTFSMKLFGEKILGGQIRFTSSPENGTVFEFAHPISGR